MTTTRATLVAFVATVAIGAPAAWRALDADIATDGPRVRPPQQSVEIDGADVTLQLDRGVVAKGDTVSATVVATAELPHDVTVAVTAYEDMGFGGDLGRVPNPPAMVGVRKLKLHAAPGGGPPVVASFALGRKAKKPSGWMSWYYVTAAAPGSSASARYGREVAATSNVYAWSGNELPIAIDVPDTLALDGPFELAVRVTNTTHEPLHGVGVSIGGRFRPSGGPGQATLEDAADVSISPADESADDDVVLAPGAQATLWFHVVPRVPGIEHLTIIAQLNAHAVKPDPEDRDHEIRTRGYSSIELRTIDRPTKLDAASRAPAPIAAK